MTSFGAFGDSITYGVGASIPAKGAIGLLAPVNLAHPGDQAAECSKVFQSMTPDGVTPGYLMIGTNDVTNYKNNTTKQAFYKQFVRHCLAWYLTPDKTYARNTTAIHYIGGSWVNTSETGNVCGLTGKGNGTATFTFTATALYLGYIIQDYAKANGTATVTIDGVLVDTITSQGAMTTAVPSTDGYACLRYGNLSQGSHTVVLNVTASANSWFYLNYLASNASAAIQPKFLLSNIIEMSASAYAAYGIDSTTVAAYNSILTAIQAEFNADGYDVVLVDNHASINPLTDLEAGANAKHPNDQGHAKIAANIKAAL